MNKPLITSIIIGITAGIAVLLILAFAFSQIYQETTFAQILFQPVMIFVCIFAGIAVGLSFMKDDDNRKEKK